MLVTIVTVALALLALGLWIRGVEPVLKGAEEADKIAVATQPNTRPGLHEAPESAKARWIVQMTMLLAFVLICMLLLVGFFATFREWVRYGDRGSIRRREKTQYVDAWKIAGERMHVAGEKPPDEEEPPATDA
ncbi:MAG: hypothetical protein ACTHN5_03380 [Phycisphaerae bacterium]